MIKISLVLFYLEIFKTRRFRITAYNFLAYLVINSLVNFFVAIFSCSPVPSFWNRDIKGKCLDIQAAAYANSGSAIVQDIILLIMPLLFIRHLNMKRRRKIAVGFMFCIGTFGCVATIMRLPALSTFKISIDPSWDYVPTTIWTELELSAGFLCVSLPSIRLLIVRLLPKRVKEFLSNITHPSRSRSNGHPTPQQFVLPEQRKWKRPSSWIDISANSTNISNDSTEKGIGPLTLGSGARGSFMSPFWNRNTTQSSQFSQLGSRASHRLLESAMSNYNESGVAVARSPHQEERGKTTFEHIQMFDVPKLHRHTSTSCRSCSGEDEQITALPQIGCIPDGLYSNTDMTKKHQRAQWSHHNKAMV